LAFRVKRKQKCDQKGKNDDGNKKKKDVVISADRIPLKVNYIVYHQITIVILIDPFCNVF